MCVGSKPSKQHIPSEVELTIDSLYACVLTACDEIVLYFYQVIKDAVSFSRNIVDFELKVRSECLQ